MILVIVPRARWTEPAAARPRCDYFGRRFHRSCFRAQLEAVPLQFFESAHGRVKGATRGGLVSEQQIQRLAHVGCAEERQRLARGLVEILELLKYVFPLFFHLEFEERSFHGVHTLVAPGGSDETVHEISFDRVGRLEALHVVLDVLDIGDGVFGGQQHETVA